MFRLKYLSVVCAALLGCQSLFSTPLLITDLIEVNNQVHSLYSACLERTTFTPTKEGCSPDALKSKIKEAQQKAKFFIASDVSQPHGYDIYLQTTLIYFSISQRNENEYTEAERIARQFFEVQKASSGISLNDARYYWSLTTAEHQAWRWNNGETALTGERKAELLLCLAEGTFALEKIETGPRKVRLTQALVVLTSITRSS